MTGTQLEAMENIVEGFKHSVSAYEMVFKVSSAAYLLANQVKTHCFAHSYVYDVITYCFVEGECGGWAMVINSGMNSFNITMNWLQVIVILATQRKTGSPRKLFDKYSGIGQSMGSILIYTMNFTPDHSQFPGEFTRDFPDMPDF